MDLLEWTEHYLKSRDAFEKRLIGFERGDGRLIAKYRDGQLLIKAFPDLSGYDAKDGAQMVVTESSSRNIDRAVDLWPLLSRKRGLKLVFVNHRTHGRWILLPAVHDKVADPSTLKQGLIAMAEGV